MMPGSDEPRARKEGRRRDSKGELRKQLVSLDPDSEANFELLRDIIEEEIRVRLALHDTPDRQGHYEDPWTVRVARLAADAVLNQFEVRLRSSPRYRWEEP
jgi:hypothetical protein